MVIDLGLRTLISFFLLHIGHKRALTPMALLFDMVYHFQRWWSFCWILKGPAQYTKILSAQSPIFSSTSCTAWKNKRYTPDLIVYNWPVYEQHKCGTHTLTYNFVRIMSLWRKKMRRRIKCMDGTERAVRSLEISGHIQENREYSSEAKEIDQSLKVWKEYGRKPCMRVSSEIKWVLETQSVFESQKYKA